MVEKRDEEKIIEQKRNKEILEERFLIINDKIIETLKERKKFEKEYLEVIENQKKYWTDRLIETDPQKNKERYEELKDKIENEETLIKQIIEELDRIDDELKQEQEHKEQEQRLRKKI